VVNGGEGARAHHAGRAVATDVADKLEEAHLALVVMME
jgi:hypothetical protein